MAKANRALQPCQLQRLILQYQEGREEIYLEEASLLTLPGSALPAQCLAALSL